jgi:hypothetical protein
MDEALLAQVLKLVLANAAAMRAVGAEGRPALRRRRAVAALASTPGAAELLRSLHTALADALAAGDAARGRARVACVCRAARTAADVTAASPAAREAEHAKARACADIYACLAPDTAALCGGAPALQRLCVAAEPPKPLPCFRSASDGSGSGDADVAAAWRTLAREVADAAPEETRPDASLEDMLAAFTVGLRQAAKLRAGELPNSRAKQLLIIRATHAEENADEALCARR